MSLENRVISILGRAALSVGIGNDRDMPLRSAVRRKEGHRERRRCKNRLSNISKTICDCTTRVDLQASIQSLPQRQTINFNLNRNQFPFINMERKKQTWTRATQCVSSINSFIHSLPTARLAAPVNLHLFEYNLSICIALWRLLTSPCSSSAIKLRARSLETRQKRFLRIGDVERRLGTSSAQHSHSGVSRRFIFMIVIVPTTPGCKVTGVKQLKNLTLVFVFSVSHWNGFMINSMVA